MMCRSPSPSTRPSVQGNTERAFHSVDPFNSFDRGTLQEQGLWKTISKRTARTSPTCSTSSEGSKNLPPFLQKTMQNMSEWPGLEYIKYTYYNYRQVRFCTATCTERIHLFLYTCTAPSQLCTPYSASLKEHVFRRAPGMISSYLWALMQ